MVGPQWRSMPWERGKKGVWTEGCDLFSRVRGWLDVKQNEPKRESSLPRRVRDYEHWIWGFELG